MAIKAFPLILFAALFAIFKLAQDRLGPPPPPPKGRWASGFSRLANPGPRVPPPSYRYVDMFSAFASPSFA